MQTHTQTLAHIMYSTATFEHADTHTPPGEAYGTATIRD